MNLPSIPNPFKKKKRKFIISLEFETEAKDVNEALKLAEKLRRAVVSVREKNNVKSAGPIA